MPTPNYVPPYLSPSTPPPAEGSALEDILHDVIAGITGLDPTLVRPRWQPEPPNIPAAATAWLAFGFQPERTTTSFPEVDHDPTGTGSDVLRQHETLVVAVSIYDLGAGSVADNYAAMLRDGLFIAQNREAMFNQGALLLIGVGHISPAPDLVKERWLYRVDFSFTVRREIDRSYAVPNIVSASGTIESQDGNADPIPTPFSVEP